MRISKVGIDLIKSFEGCYLKAYKCPAGVWTIGWGTTEPINGIKPHEGMVITQKQADDLLIKNLKSYENAVNKYVTYSKLNQNQYDALVSFTYNCGAGALQKSDLLNRINKGDVLGTADEFLRWNKGGGKVLPGLVRRREAERKLFLEEEEEVIKKVKIKLNGVEKDVDAIEKDGHNYVKLQDIRDEKIDISYDGVPIIKVKAQ
ncbi:lysozyme [Niameybacter massiliensis]|uniref:lysozyme n=1 Tax=Niameybacter massiliensis TaxID=1658108 RepID=UPI0009E64236|nr:lysozyme [Niameybacter massiliensis]